MAKTDEQKDTNKSLPNPFQFPLIMTPEKLEIPSSGHLDVEIKNPTNNQIKIDCTINSFSFKFERAWILKDGKKIDVKKGRWIERLSHKMEGHDVLHIKIKCEDTFNGKKSGTYEKSSEFGFLEITCEVKIQLLHPSQRYALTKEFHMNAFKTFPLSIEPNCEKAKMLVDAFLEQQKNQERLQRIKDCHTKEEKDWLDVTEEGGILYDWERKYRMEQWNEKILKKYGAKIDQLSDDEIRKMKEDLVKSFEKEQKKKEKAKEEKWEKEKEEDEARRQQELKKKEEQKKKCVVM